jgi:very-short-patch-repair endonuclease
MSVGQARGFRKNTTDPEKRLWSCLRNRKVAGLKFRRQHPVGDRVVDFFCAEAKLAIELDGAGHSRHFGQTSDLDKEIELHEKGIRVLRFHNSDILENLDGVLNKIIYVIDPEKSLWPNVD